MPSGSVMQACPRTGAKGPRPLIEPALDALKPALAKQIPVAFDVNEAREIDRALKLAAEFGLDPIVVGASSAAEPGLNWPPRKRA